MTTHAETERRLAALEAVVPAISRIEEKIDTIVYMAGTMRLIEERQLEQRKSIEEGDDRIGTLEGTVTSSLSLAKGVVVTATVFWTLLQGGVAYLITDTLQTVRAHDVAIAQLKQLHEKSTEWPTSTPPKN